MADNNNNNKQPSQQQSQQLEPVKVKSPDAIKKAENNLKGKQAEQEYNQNLELLQYYMRIAVPIKEEKKVEEDKAKRNSDGTLALKDGKKQMEKVERTYYETVGFRYSNVKVEGKDGGESESLPIKDWIQRCFGDKIVLDEKTNTLTIKEDNKEEQEKK